MAEQIMQNAAGKTIPAGYKQTEVGVIPEDWEVAPIGSVLSITTGARNTQDKVDDGRYPFFVRSQTVERINTYSFDGEAVLTAGDGVGTGKIFHYVNGKFDFHQRVYLMYNFGERVSGYFFYLYFSNNFFERIMSMTAKSSVDSVRREMIADMKMVLPSKVEQTAIAKVLSDSDALIDALEQLIAKKQAIKSATMQQLLTGRTRLPAFALRPDGTPKGYKPSELGDIPEDWEVVELGSCIKLVVDNRGKTPPLSTNGFPMLEVNAVYKQGRSPNLEKVTKYVSKTTFENWFRDGHPIAGDILVVTVGSAGETSFVNAEGYCIAQNLIGLRLRNNFDKSFIYYLTTFFPFKKQVDAVLMGAVQPSLKVPHLKKFRLLIPLEKKEQTAIATILSDMDNELKALTQKLEKARELKQGMMQQLLTGKIRLPLAAGA
ncbi:restriction endonuclease subunit S [Aeromonas caviae]